MSSRSRVAILMIFISLRVWAGDIWKPVGTTDLSISAQSILDFSVYRDARRDGKVRYLCATQPYGVEQGFPDHTIADVYARQLRLHGYNMARFHFVDNILMAGRTKDFDFDPIQLDRFHYFLSALKREGIAWVMDGMTSWNAAYGDVGGDRWVSKRNVKAGIYYDPDQQEHWKELIRRLLGTRNPYTGLRVIDDPMLYGIILVNEGGMNHLVNLKNQPELDRLFEQWVLKRYGTLAAARKAWGTYGPNSQRITLPRGIWTANPWVQDAQRFYFETQRDTIRWMTEFIRTLGYRGPISSFNNWVSLQDQASRAFLPWVAMNSYHDAPSNYVYRGSRVGQTSSLANGLEYVRALSSSRYWGKPYSVAEHDHPFWNSWRYESGLAVGAYAALQDWDTICRHAVGPIELAYGHGKGSRRKAIYPYGIGMDPVARANETLAALLYLRGDVSPAKHRIGVRLSEEYVFDKRGGIGQLPKELTKFGLVTGFGLIWDKHHPDMPLDAIIEPDGKMPTLANKLMARIGLAGEKSFSDILKNLQSYGVLAGNQSDGKKKFFSDHEQIILDTDSKLLKVITPRTEAAAFETAPGKVDKLTINQSSTPAMISASSMDGRKLEQSNRILLILATDARNTGMRFADAEERELVALGSLPVLIRTARLEIRLRHSNPGDFTLYALHLNGDRAEKLPLTVDKNDIVFNLDTAVLRHGPTTYFELVAE